MSGAAGKLRVVESLEREAECKSSEMRTDARRAREPRAREKHARNTREHQQPAQWFRAQWFSNGTFQAQPHGHAIFFRIPQNYRS